MYFFNIKFMNFKIGQKVIALSNSNTKYSQPRIKGCIYIVNKLMYTSCCGKQLINIGFKYEKSPNFSCHTCNISQLNHGWHWTFSTEFVGLDDLDAKIAECVKNEDYETAHLLQKILEQEFETIKKD